MPDDPHAQQSTDSGTSSGGRRSSSSSTSSRSSTATDEMEEQTPAAAGDVLLTSDSRLNALRDAGPKRRQQLVWIQYEGRKGSTGGVRRTQDEHIDVIVPDEDNEGAADLYLDQGNPAGVMTPAAKKLLAEQGVSHETLQLSGTGYHFNATAGPTPVDPDHADWLLNHAGLAFSKVDPPS